MNPKQCNLCELLPEGRRVMQLCYVLTFPEDDSIPFTEGEHSFWGNYTPLSLSLIQQWNSLRFPSVFPGIQLGHPEESMSLAVSWGFGLEWVGGENIQISVITNLLPTVWRSTLNKQEQVLTHVASPWSHLPTSRTRLLPSTSTSSLTSENSSLYSQFQSREGYIMYARTTKPIQFSRRRVGQN